MIYHLDLTYHCADDGQAERIGVSMAEFIGAETWLDHAERAIQTVRELHQPNGDMCQMLCTDTPNDPQVATYPCPTVALLDATPATTAGEGTATLRYQAEAECMCYAKTTEPHEAGCPVVQPDAAATCGHTGGVHYWVDGIRYWSEATHSSFREPCPASTDDGTGTR